MNNALDDINNYAQILGKIVGKVERNFEAFGEGFYGFNLAISRLSEEIDTIPVTISERIVKAKELNLVEGEELCFSGEFRSYNKNVDGKSRLMLHFFVHNVISEEELLNANDLEPVLGDYVPVNKEHGANHNLIKLEGFICKPPIYRVTPFNREICDVLLAINRPNHTSKTFCKSDYIPCILWGRNARFAGKMAIGDKIRVMGRIQSRDYNKKQENGAFEVKTAYEISCQSVVLCENESKSKKEEEIV